MKLTGLTLNNFGAYYGKQTIRFDSPKVGRNVWLFEGLNGAGKTTLFLSLIWALYGEDGVKEFTKRTNAEERKTIDLISKQARNQGKPYMGVEVYFDHEDKKCILVRRIVPKKAYIDANHDIQETVSLSIDGHPEDPPEPKILEILPRDVSQFFFFDGEQVRRYAEPTSRETHEAIEHVLGVPMIRDTAGEMKQVATEINRELQNASAQVPSDKAIAGMLNQKEDHRKKLESKEAALKEVKAGLDELTQRKIQLDSELEGLEAVKELQSKKLELEREISLDRTREAELNSQKEELKDDLPFVLMRNQLQDVYEKFRARRDDEDITIKKDRYQVLLAFTEGLLREENCVCGNKIEAFEKAALKNRVKAYSTEIDKINELLSIKLVPSLEELSGAAKFARAKKADFRGLDSKIAGLELEIRKTESEKKRIEKQLRESKVAEASKLQKELDQTNDAIINSKATITTTEREIQEIKDKITELDRYLRDAKAYSPTIESLKRQYALADKLGDALDQVISDLIPAKKKIIEEAASRALESIAHKGVFGDIKITDGYSIEVHNKKGEPDEMERSAGENEIIALSFILGLKEAAEKDAPVIADFIFGKLDQAHRSNLIESLPSFGEQVIVFKILNGELNESQLRRLNDLAAGRFLIDFDSKSETSTIKRVT